MSEWLRVTFLGTGTSQGVPMVGCDCLVCLSTDSRDVRSRCSLYMETEEAAWVVDTGPDFRHQCLRWGVRRVDAALFTHSHTDHIMGFDDLRPFSKGGRTIDVFGSTPTLDVLARIFDFAFAAETRFPGYLHPVRRDVDGRFEVGGLTVDPVWLPHGRMVTTGYVFSRGGRRLFAYMTDCSSVPEEAMRVAEGAEHVVVDGLREREHPTHMTYAQAVESLSRMRAGRGWLTHLCHDFRHVEVEGRLPSGVGVAYDGMVLEI